MNVRPRSRASIEPCRLRSLSPGQRPMATQRARHGSRRLSSLSRTFLSTCSRSQPARRARCADIRRRSSRPFTSKRPRSSPRAIGSGASPHQCSLRKAGAQSLYRQSCTCPVRNVTGSKRPRLPWPSRSGGSGCSGGAARHDAGLTAHVTHGCFATGYKTAVNRFDPNSEIFFRAGKFSRGVNFHPSGKLFPPGPRCRWAADPRKMGIFVFPRWGSTGPIIVFLPGK